MAGRPKFRATLAAVGRYAKSVDPDMVGRMRREGYKTDDVSVGRYVMEVYPSQFNSIVGDLRSEGAIRNPRAGFDNQGRSLAGVKRTIERQKAEYEVGSKISAAILAQTIKETPLADWTTLKGVEVLRSGSSRYVAAPRNGKRSAATFDIIDIEAGDLVTQLKKGEVYNWLFRMAQAENEGKRRNPRRRSLVRNPSGADASIYSPPIGFDSTKGMRGWVSLMRGHVLDSEAGTPERSRRVDEVKRALNYAGFLTRGRSISKVYAETAKQTADWLHTVSDHATRNPARRLVRNPYLEKVLFPSGNWQYRYSQEDVAKRHAKKASRIESLKGREASLRAGVKRDVADGDVVALAVAMILETYERPGNNESARAGHFGVTGWQCRHLDLHKNRAVIDYIAKSGVHQTKVITTPWIVRALADRQRQCNANGGRLLPTSAASVNAYLDSYDISAKDLRTFGANTEMQRELTAIRKAGPDLSLLKPRDVAKTLKAEFNAALGLVAAKLGHTTSVLRKQYLVQGIEPLYLETGTVLQSFA